MSEMARCYENEAKINSLMEKFQLVERKLEENDEESEKVLEKITVLETQMRFVLWGVYGVLATMIAFFLKTLINGI